ncbi:MAG: hypothetical protein ABEJ95_01300 [Candidatus Nanohalobium sp.]
MSEVDVESVARITGESEEEVVRRGLESYVESELRQCRARVKELEREYGVGSLEELENEVESGGVEEHPAWEAVIEWRNLKDRIERLVSRRKVIEDAK